MKSVIRPPRLISLGVAAVLIYPALLAAPTAQAAAGCSTTTPALQVQVVCSSAGTESITVPSGAGYALVTVVGGGGGGAASYAPQGVPGSAVSIVGRIQLPANTATLAVVVGAGGTASSALGSAASSRGGGGGGGSALFALDGSSAVLSDLVIAGGGGGAGSHSFYNGGVAPGNKDGGSAGLPNATAGSGGGTLAYTSMVADPGTGASVSAVGTGGSASGPGAASGSSGGVHVAGVVAAGANRTNIMYGTQYPVSGGGGGGYTGGGSGGGGVDGGQMMGAGAGGGSSYVDTSYVTVNSANVVSAAGPGYRGSSAYYVAPTAGTAGQVAVTFSVSPFAAAPTVSSVGPSVGATTGGTAVTITGTGFQSGATVSIGGVAATSVSVVSATQVVATTGAHGAGVTNVTVTNPDTQSATGTGLFTYAVAPTVTAISPSSGTTLGGDAVTITGTGFVSGATVTIGGVPATNVVLGSSTSMTASSPAGSAGAADVVVTNPDTLSGTGVGLFAFVAPPTPSGAGGSSQATVTINFNANGGTGTVQAISGAVGSWVQVPSGSGLSRAGFSFLGWNTAPDGSGTAFRSGSSLELTGNNTLFARWAVDSQLSPGAQSLGTSEASSGPLGPRTEGLPSGGVPAGGAFLSSNGVPIDVTVQPNANVVPVALVVNAPGLTPPLNMRLEGRGDESDPLGLTSKQALILQSQVVQGRSLRAKAVKVQPVAQSSGDGFRATSPVKFYLLPSTYLGELMTDANGVYKGSVPIPAGIRPGVYTLQANGFAPDDSVRSLSVGVLVKPTTVAVKTASAKASVFFDSLSPELTSAGKASLRALVKETGRQAITVRSVGFVQPTGTTSNDETLSTARARNVAAYLRSLGVRGVYVVRGDGRDSATGAKARRVDVTITYPKR